MTPKAHRETECVVNPSSSCVRRSAILVFEKRGRTEMGESSGCRVERGHLTDGAERSCFGPSVAGFPLHDICLRVCDGSDKDVGDEGT